MRVCVLVCVTQKNLQPPPPPLSQQTDTFTPHQNEYVDAVSGVRKEGGAGGTLTAPPLSRFPGAAPDLRLSRPSAQ